MAPDTSPDRHAENVAMTDWKAIADLLATALRQCQVPADWQMAWPDGMSEGTPWVDEALAAYEAAQSDGYDQGLASQAMREEAARIDGDGGAE